MEITICYVRSLNPYICEEILKELRRMSCNVCSNLIDISNITAAERRSQRLLMKHTQPRQSINTKTGEKVLLTFMPGDTTDAPSAGTNISKEQGPKLHLHPPDTLEMVFKQQKVLHLKSVPTADDPFKSPQ